MEEEINNKVSIKYALWIPASIFTIFALMLNILVISPINQFRSEINGFRSEINGFRSEINSFEETVNKRFDRLEHQIEIQNHRTDLLFEQNNKLMEILINQNK